MKLSYPLALVASSLLLVNSSEAAEPAVLFGTQFEPAEGYDSQFTLAGQPAAGSVPWEALGTGGNGLLTETNAFTGFGQQAYVGFFPPTTQERDTFVWRPIGLSVIPPETPVIQFTTLVEIVDSTNEKYDEFQWIVSNTAEEPLVTVSFENNSREIFYIRDGMETFQSTGVKFDSNTRYSFELTLDFAENTWSAKLDESVLVTGQPIALPATLRDLGDVAAAWVVKELATPGDNFMAFDSYQIAALPVGPEIPPSLTALGFVEGRFGIRLQGVNSKTYAIERSSDLRVWQEAGRGVAIGGVFEFRDPEISGTQRAYRARRVP